MQAAESRKSSPEDRALILVVDDEEPICRSLSGVLRDEGYGAICACDGEEALEMVLRHKPKVVFLDIWMPGRDGLETLQMIKEVSPETEVIMISGHATIANALEATKRGAFDFIEKPFDVESVVLCAERALQRRRQVAGEYSAGADLQSSQFKGGPQMSHAGVLSSGLRGANLGQRTLKRSAILYGKGLHSGQKSGLVLEPLPRDSGIHFARIGEPKSVPAFIDYVDRVSFSTTIRRERASASTVEHLLATLHAYRVSNLLVKCNAEVPILDGSALDFCELLESVGLEEQGGQWFELAVKEPVSVIGNEISHGDARESIVLEPAEGFIVSYELDYPMPVGRQYYEYRFQGVESFKKEIAPARTFGFMKDIEQLQRAGLAAGGSLDNFILIGSEGVINTELRYADELARHKILDILGDFFLLGRPVRGRIRARMTGHSDNVRLVRILGERII